jgi:hypothetical protein
MTVLFYWTSKVGALKTTIRIDDELLQRAWREAQRRGISLASLLEQGLELALKTPPPSAARITRLSEIFRPRKEERVARGRTTISDAEIADSATSSGPQWRMDKD